MANHSPFRKREGTKRKINLNGFVFQIETFTLKKQKLLHLLKIILDKLKNKKLALLLNFFLNKKIGCYLSN